MVHQAVENALGFLLFVYEIIGVRNAVSRLCLLYTSPLWVGDKEVDLLSGFVQCGGGLAATVDFLVRREADYGIDAA